MFLRPREHQGEHRLSAGEHERSESMGRADAAAEGDERLAGLERKLRGFVTRLETCVESPRGPLCSWGKAR